MLRLMTGRGLPRKDILGLLILLFSFFSGHCVSNRDSMFGWVVVGTSEEFSYCELAFRRGNRGNRV